ncbi:MAG: hypothetical protein JSS82_12630 [Bacteroidetes bacterium]|nr:hypothetical protein [Bacteroidota bacterium]
MNLVTFDTFAWADQSFRQWLSTKPSSMVMAGPMEQLQSYLNHIFNGKDKSDCARILIEIEETFISCPSIGKLRSTSAWKKLEPATVSTTSVGECIVVEPIQPYATTSIAMDVERDSHTRVVSLVSEVEQLTSTVESLTNMLRNREKEMARLNEQHTKEVQDMHLVKNDLEYRLESKIADSRRLASELDVLRKREKEFEAATKTDNGQLLKQLNSKERELADLKYEFENMRKRFWNLESDIKDRDKRISYLENNLEAAGALYRSLEKKNESLTEEICILKAKELQSSSVGPASVGAPSVEYPLTAAEMDTIAFVLNSNCLFEMEFSAITETSYWDWKKTMPESIHSEPSLNVMRQYVRFSISASGLTANQLGERMFKCQHVNFQYRSDMSFFRTKYRVNV